MAVKITAAVRQEQRDYVALCDRARAAGVPTSLDDPRTTRIIAEFRAQVEAAEKAAH